MKTKSFAILAIALTATGLTAQVTGNRNIYENSLTLSIDTVLKSPGDYVIEGDAYQGFRKMGFTEMQIMTTRQQAEEWFLERFGYDFTKVTADANGVKMLSGIMEAPFHIDENASYRAILLKNGLQKKLDIMDAGISFTMMEEGLMYHGSYGGKMGREAMMMEGVGYGYYSIPGAGPNGATSLLKYHADTPMHMTADMDMTIRCKIESADFGNGYEIGLGAMKMTEDGQYHLMYRNVLTFPDTTFGDMDMPPMMDMMMMSHASKMALAKAATLR